MEHASTVLLRIVVPHRAYGEYAADAGAVRLRAVQYPKDAGPADLGVIFDTHAADGGELETLLLGEVAHPPDCLVEARPLGLLTIVDKGQPSTYVVAAAAADPAFDGVTEVAALAPSWCDRLQRFFQDVEQIRWNDREAARALIHQARQAARLARAGVRRPSAGPAWRPDQAAPLVQNGAAPETVRHSRAEYAFYALPLRFQKYVADYLMPLERVRFFVPRPRMLSAIAHGLLRRKRLAEGILILTTEQLLFLEEVLPPDVTEMPHGYLVRGVPIERLVDVALDDRGSVLVLGWATATDAGQEWLQIEFPPARRDELLCLSSGAGATGRVAPDGRHRRAEPTNRSGAPSEQRHMSGATSDPAEPSAIPSDLLGLPRVLDCIWMRLVQSAICNLQSAIALGAL